MTTYISPYTPGLVLPQYKTTNYDPSLEIALLEKKQKDFDTFLARVNNLKSQAVNITMLNEKGMERLKVYNDELNQMLSGDPGDLTDPQVQAKIAGYFSKVAGDSDLKRRSKISSQYATWNKDIEDMRTSKDPKKREGYNAINEYVYKHDTGGLYDFVKADDIAGWESKMSGYVPYKDVDQKLVNITKLAKERFKITQTPYTVTDKDGKVVSTPYFKYTENRGVSEQQLRTLLETTLDADEMAQFNVLTKYRILTSDPESLYNTYESFMDTSLKKTQGTLETIRSQKALFDPAKLPKDATDEKRAEYTKLKALLEEQEAFYEKKVEYHNINMVDKATFNNLSNQDKFKYMQNITVETYINRIASALNTESTIEKFIPDPTYFQGLNYNLNVQKEANEQMWRQAQLELKRQEMILKSQAEAAKAAGGGGDNAVVPGVYFADDKSLIPTLDEMDKIYKSYDDKLKPIVTGGGTKPEDLMDNGWLSKNKDNFEVQLWSHYKSTNANPTVEGFKTFLAAVEKGDYSNNSVVESLYRDYQNSQDIRNWMDKQRNIISQRVSELADIENVKAPGGQNSIKDYSNGRRNEKGEIVISVPVDPQKSSYKDMTWSEIKEEFIKGAYESAVSSGNVKRATEIAQYLSPFLGPSGTVVGAAAGIGGFISSILNYFDIGNGDDYKGILKNDQGLYETIRAGLDKENRARKDIGSKIDEILPGYMANTQVKLTGNKITKQHTGDIQQAFRTHSSKPAGWWSNAQVSPIIIENSDVESVILPTVGNLGGYTLSKDGAKKIKESYPELKLTGTDGELRDVLPNTMYRFNTQPIQSQDAFLDIMFKSTGEIKRKMHGYDVSIVRNPANPGIIYITIPNISPTATEINGDVNITDILQTVSQGILAHKQTTANTPK